MPDDEDIPTPSLIREARAAYGLAVRKALSKIGLSELPRNSAFLLGGLHGSDLPFDSLVNQRRRSLEQSGTVAALFATGCLAQHNGDTVLTERGREAAHACADARAALDATVIEAIGSEGFATMRQGLVALIDWKEAAERH